MWRFAEQAHETEARIADRVRHRALRRLGGVATVHGSEEVASVGVAAFFKQPE